MMRRYLKSDKAANTIFSYYWHGTNTIFYNFDLELCGTCEGNGHGKGIYLADFKLDAAQYAKYANFRLGGNLILCLTLLETPTNTSIDAKTRLCDIPSSITKRLRKELNVSLQHENMTFEEFTSEIRATYSKEKEFSALTKAGIKAITNFWDDGLAKKAMVARVLDPNCIRIISHEIEVEIIPNPAHPGDTELVWVVV